MPEAPPVLECQDCGVVVRKLTPAENQRVAAEPYNFVVYCQQCRADIEREDWGRA